MSSSYPTTFHRDHTVTVWSVFQQEWLRLPAQDAFSDDRLMSSLDSLERARIEASANGRTLGAAKRLARRIYAAADDGGTIQAWDMVPLFPGQPTLHTTCQMDRAWSEAGVTYAARLAGLSSFDD